MARTRIVWIAAAVCVIVVISVLLARSTIFANSSARAGLCDRELQPGQAASKSLTAEAINQSRALAQATPFGTPPPNMIEETQHIAKARQSGGDSVIATVGNQSITLGELRAAEEVGKQSQAEMVKNMAAPLPPSAQRIFEEHEKLIKQAGIPNVALAGLISDDVVYQYAVEQGCRATPQAVADRVAHDRSLAAQGRQPGLAVSASIYGPDFWTSDYPEIVRRLLATNRLHAALSASLIPPPLSTTEATPPATAWNSLSWRLIQQAHITVKDQSVMDPASVSGALTYLKNYYAADFGD